MIPETKEIEIIPKGDIKIAECGGIFTILLEYSNPLS
jgi:hypothetical protein